MHLPSLKKMEVAGKTVLVRTDFDVPLAPFHKGRHDFVVADDFRIRRAMPTIVHLLREGAKPVLISKLGRPKGIEPEFSLEPAAQRVAELLPYYKFAILDKIPITAPKVSRPHVFFLKADIENADIRPFLDSLPKSSMAVLENLMFYPGEKDNTPEFAKKLAALGDIYVNDSFATAHRSYASVASLPALLPSAAGIELMEEVQSLSRAIQRPKRPLVMMVGGIKIASKLAGLATLIELCDRVIVGGGLAALFFKCKGYPIGNSAIDDTMLLEARELLRNFSDKIILPADVVVARSPDRPATLRTAKPEQIGAGEMILDIGPAAIRAASIAVKEAQTLIWSGPMGMFEVKHFSHGTLALGRLFASRSKGMAYGVAGGGDTLAAVKRLKMGEYIDYLSTGGSAMLDFLAGEEMPGLEALVKKL